MAVNEHAVDRPGRAGKTAMSAQQNAHQAGTELDRQSETRKLTRDTWRFIVTSTRFGVVAFVSALLLAGCGDEKKEEQAAAPAAEQPAQPATQEQTASTE